MEKKWYYTRTTKFIVNFVVIISIYAFLHYKEKGNFSLAYNEEFISPTLLGMILVNIVYLLLEFDHTQGLVNKTNADIP